VKVRYAARRERVVAGAPDDTPLSNNNDVILEETTR